MKRFADSNESHILMTFPPALQPPPQQEAPAPSEDPQEDPEVPQEAPFKCVPSLLKVCSGHRTYKYPVSVEELRRRTAPPESMSINTMTSLLRNNKNEKANLKEELNKAGVFPGPSTKVTSLCTRLTEGEAKELCHSVGVLAAKGIHFEAVTMPLPSDPCVAAGKATELKHQLQHLAKEVQRNGQVFEHLSHGLGPGMVDVVVNILTDCIDASMAKLQ